MEVLNSLDSPGTSSGYCSGTEEDMAFTVSMFETGLPTGCPDVFADHQGSFSSYLDADSSLDCEFPDDQDSLMMMNTITSGSEVRTENDDEVENFDDRQSRELGDSSWLFEMLFGSQSSTSEEEDLRNVDRNPYDLALEIIDFDTQLLTLPEKTEEGPTEVLSPIACQYIPPPCGDPEGFSKEQARSNESTEYEKTAGNGEDAWNVLMSLDDWDEVCDEEEVLFVDDDDPLALKDIWTDADVNPAKLNLCDDDIDESSLAAVSTVEHCPETNHHNISPNGMTRLTCSAVALNCNVDKQVEVETLESTRGIDAPSWTSPTGPSSFRASPPVQLQLSTGCLPSDQSSRPSYCLRRQPSPPRRTSSTTAPPTTQSTTHHMLEDHRYSSRRIEQVVKPVHRTTTTTRQQEVSESSKCSVLETLLRTSVRFNPNHGSSFIITKESKKRPLTLASKTQTAKQSTSMSQQMGNKRPNHNSNNNTLLHNLLTCRMEEVERNRGGNRKSGKDHLTGRKNSLVVGLIPSDDPVVDCSFLYDADQDLNVEYEHSVDSRMAWMEKVMDEGYDKVSPWVEYYCWMFNS